MSVALLAVLFVLGVGPREAGAERAPFTFEARPVWFLMGGFTGGYTAGLDQRGPFVGGELSLVRIRDRGFLGVYADGFYDFGLGTSYASAGPELGLLRRSRTMPVAVGLDGGVALRFSDEVEVGAAARLFVNISGAFTIYGRYMHFGADVNDRVVQVGAMLKFPLISPFGPATR